MVWKNIYFWLETVVFLAIVIVSAVKIIPPAVRTMTDSRAMIKTLDTKISEERQFATSVAELDKNQDQLDKLANLAIEALPTKPDGEELQLQIDGLLASLNLPNATATVPLSAGTGTNTNQLAVTIAGDYNYNQAKELIKGLRGLIRWNKITGFELSQNGTVSHFSFNFNVAYKPGTPKTFTGTPKLLDRAETLFTSYKSYTTRPDINTEGTYGKDDPFAKP